MTKTENLIDRVLECDARQETPFCTACNKAAPVLAQIAKRAVGALRSADILITDGWSVQARDNIRETISDIEALAASPDK